MTRNIVKETSRVCLSRDQTQIGTSGFRGLLNLYSFCLLSLKTTQVLFFSEGIEEITSTNINVSVPGSMEAFNCINFIFAAASPVAGFVLITLKTKDDDILGQTEIYYFTTDQKEEPLENLLYDYDALKRYFESLMSPTSDGSPGNSGRGTQSSGTLG